MSVVVSIKHKDHYVFVSDSRSSMDSCFIKRGNNNEYKIGKVIDDDHAIIGHTGTSRDISIIKTIPGLTNSYTEQFPAFDYDYVYNVLMQKIRDDYFDLNIGSSRNTHQIPTRLLVAKDDKCFQITPEGGLVKINDFSIIGSGSTAGEGAWCGTMDMKDNFIRALLAVKAAIKYDNFCGYPIIVASTNKDEIYVLNKKEVNQIINKEKELDI